MSRRAFATAAATAAVAITTPPPVAVLTPAIAVSNVRGPAAPGAVAAHRRGPPAVAPFRKLEAERALDRVRLGEAQRQPLADAVGLARLIADELLRALVVAEIFRAEVLREQQPVAAQVLHRREETERLDAADTALHQLPDLVREIG